MHGENGLQQALAATEVRGSLLRLSHGHRAPLTTAETPVHCALEDPHAAFVRVPCAAPHAVHNWYLRKLDQPDMTHILATYRH